MIEINHKNKKNKEAEAAIKGSHTLGCEDWRCEEI